MPQGTPELCRAPRLPLGNTDPCDLSSMRRPRLPSPGAGEYGG